MFSGLIVCLLVAGAMASKPGRPFGAVHGVGAPPAREHPEPCCVPSYFTFSQALTTTSVGYGGGLSVEFENSEGAYDSVSEQIGVKTHIDFLNGTERYSQFIGDYKEGVSYVIFGRGHTVSCYVNELEEKFPEKCVPKNATFVAESTLGDRDLVVDSWYSVEDDGTEHVLTTVGREGCVPVRVFQRSFDQRTGGNYLVSDTGYYDFNLGICDRDKYFKPPPECDKGRALLAQPTPEMQKMIRRKGLFR